MFPGRPPRLALDGLSLRVPAGQFAALVGPSGCGKSTLLRLAANLLAPSAGRIVINGLTPAQAIAGHHVAWMSQSPALLPWLDARANVALARRFAGQTPGRGNNRPALSAEEALARVGLADAAGAYPHMLSGGMQQRLALARTLSVPAGLWLMDEPFAALDELTRERLAIELLDLWNLPGDGQKPTVLWVTHNLHEALRLADRVLVLSPRPAHLAADITVQLPRPREEGMPGWIEHLRSIRAALEEE